MGNAKHKRGKAGSPRVWRGTFGGQMETPSFPHQIHGPPNRPPPPPAARIEFRRAAGGPNPIAAPERRVGAEPRFPGSNARGHDDKTRGGIDRHAPHTRSGTVSKHAHTNRIAFHRPFTTPPAPARTRHVRHALRS